jgi:hypothetical protein
VYVGAFEGLLHEFVHPPGDTFDDQIFATDFLIRVEILKTKIKFSNKESNFSIKLNFLIGGVILLYNNHRNRIFEIRLKSKTSFISFVLLTRFELK